MPDWSKFNDIPFERRFSASKAVMLDQCPGRFGHSYDDKVKEPPGPPIWNGNYFEWLLAGKKNDKGKPCSNPVPMLTPHKQTLLLARHRAYKKLIKPTFELQVPIKKEIPDTALNDDLGNFYLIGFLDIRDPETGAIIDTKVSGEPWDIKKFSYSMRQAQSYVFATGEKDFTFDVVNLKTEEIQHFPGDRVTQAIFDEWVSDTQMDYYLMWLRAMIKIMVTGDRCYKRGPLCDWCYYKRIKLCEEFYPNVAK